MSKIIISDHDKRVYEHVVLSNNLQVLLISDPDTDKSSAAMDVGVGFFHDPPEIPGLAHFLEHMLFLGTKKYPQEGTYQDYIKKHGGRSNAYTNMHNTNYYFDIRPEYLAEALDQFAHFFIDPLLNEEVSDREMKAVDSENSKNLQSDPWRNLQFIKNLANPSHPFSKFGTGNLDTLLNDPLKHGIKVRDALLKFHQSYYSSNAMKLCILSKESIQEQKKYLSIFEEIPNKNVVIDVFDKEPIFDEKTFQVYHIVPVKNLNRLSLQWVLPYPKEFYLSKPDRYFGHLFGHEGPGSIFALVKSKGWANALSAGSYIDFSYKMIFEVFVDLTFEGEAHVDEIVSIVYAYIEILKKEGIQKWIWQECSDLASVAFKFKEKQDPFSYTSRLARNMQIYDPLHVISGETLFDSYNPDELQQVLNHFVLKKMIFLITSKSNQDKALLVEKWYGTNYFSESFSSRKGYDAWIHPKEDLIHLPSPNPFIPTNLNILEVQEECPVPVCIHQDKMMKIWHKQDFVFLKPKSIIMFNLIIPTTYASPQNMMCARLFGNMIVDSLNEYAYDASVAGLSYSVDATSDGLALTCAGYNDKIFKLIGVVFEKMNSILLDKTRFEVLREKLSRNYVNFAKDQPYQHAITKSVHILYQKRFEYTEYIQVLRTLSFDHFDKFVSIWMSSVRLEALFTGNIDKKQVLDFVHVIKSWSENKIILMPSQEPDERIIQLQNTVKFEMIGPNEQDVNSAIEIVVQIGKWTAKSHALLKVIAHIFESPFYDQLRTKQQIGYLVFSRERVDHNVISMSMILQSSERSPVYMQEKCDDFMNEFASILNEMKEEDVLTHVSSVGHKLLEKDKQLREEAINYWGEIQSRQYKFDRKKVTADELQGVSKQEIVDFWEKNMLNNSKRLLVHVFANQVKNEMLGTNVIESVDDFKLKSPTWSAK